MACFGHVHGSVAAHSTWRRHFPFRLTGGERWVSIFGKDATALGDMISGTRAVYGRPIEVSGGELELTDMVGAPSVVARSPAVAVVAVKWMVDIDSRTYGEDQMRERERASRGARVVAGHGELVLGGAPWPWR